MLLMRNRCTAPPAAFHCAEEPVEMLSSQIIRTLLCAAGWWPLWYFTRARTASFTAAIPLGHRPGAVALRADVAVHSSTACCRPGVFPLGKLCHTVCVCVCAIATLQGHESSVSFVVPVMSCTSGCCGCGMLCRHTFNTMASLAIA